MLISHWIIPWRLHAYTECSCADLYSFAHADDTTQSISHSSLRAAVKDHSTCTSVRQMSMSDGRASKVVSHAKLDVASAKFVTVVPEFQLTTSAAMGEHQGSSLPSPKCTFERIRPSSSLQSALDAVVKQYVKVVGHGNEPYDSNDRIGYQNKAAIFDDSDTTNTAKHETTTSWHVLSKQDSQNVRDALQREPSSYPGIENNLMYTSRIHQTRDDTIHQTSHVVPASAVSTASASVDAVPAAAAALASTQIQSVNMCMIYVARTPCKRESHATSSELCVAPCVHPEMTIAGEVDRVYWFMQCQTTVTSQTQCSTRHDIMDTNRAGVTGDAATNSRVTKRKRTSDATCRQHVSSSTRSHRVKPHQYEAHNDHSVHNQTHQADQEAQHHDAMQHRQPSQTLQPPAQRRTQQQPLSHQTQPTQNSKWLKRNPRLSFSHVWVVTSQTSHFDRTIAPNTIKILQQVPIHELCSDAWAHDPVLHRLRQSANRIALHCTIMRNQSQSKVREKYGYGVRSHDRAMNDHCHILRLCVAPIVKYHGTAWSNVSSIRRWGLRSRHPATNVALHNAKPPMLGEGFYFADLRKAVRFAMWSDRYRPRRDGAVIQCRIFAPEVNVHHWLPYAFGEVCRCNNSICLRDKTVRPYVDHHGLWMRRWLQHRHQSPSRHTHEHLNDTSTAAAVTNPQPSIASKEAYRSSSKIRRSAHNTTHNTAHNSTSTESSQELHNTDFVTSMRPHYPVAKLQKTKLSCGRWLSKSHEWVLARCAAHQFATHAVGHVSLRSASFNTTSCAESPRSAQYRPDFDMQNMFQIEDSVSFTNDRRRQSVAAKT